MLTCDAEIRSKSGAWKGCNKSTAIMYERQTAKGGTLCYCTRHKQRALNPRHEHYTPAPLSVAREIVNRET